MTLAVVTEDVALKIHHHLVCALWVVGVLADDVTPVAREVPHLDLVKDPCVLESVRCFDRHDRAEEVLRQVIHVR